MMYGKMAKSNIKNAMSVNDIEWTNKGIKPSFRIPFINFQLEAREMQIRQFPCVS